MSRSISSGSRTLSGVTSTPAKAPPPGSLRTGRVPEAMAGSRMTAARVMLGMTSLSSSSHFAADAELERGKARDIAARPGQARDKSSSDRIGDDHEHDRHGVSSLAARAHSRAADLPGSHPARDATISAACLRKVGIVRVQTGTRFERCGRRSNQIPSALARTPKCEPMCFLIVSLRASEHADARAPVGLLRPRRLAATPPRRRAALRTPAASCRAWAPSQVPPPIIAGRNRRAQAV